MNYIALCGPMYAGKTTLARALEAEGYIRIGFTDELKAMAVRSLGAAGVRVTVKEMNENKQVYRAFLQCLGTLTDFDTNPKYVQYALLDWWTKKKPKAVFDNVRFPEQWETLKGYGFELVQISIPTYIQRARADVLGVNSEALEIMMRHSCEQGIDGEHLVLDGTRPIEQLVDQLVNY